MGGGCAKNGGGSANAGEGVKFPSIIHYKICAYFEDKSKMCKYGGGILMPLLSPILGYKRN